jgi:8-oxo-dGTP pyrophosphatase MutT (NUDIX family)
VLDIKLDRSPVAAPKDAATIILVRSAASASAVEVFCVERSKQSRFLGGAIVFPGGKLDPSDADDAWTSLATDVRRPVRQPATPFANDGPHLRALAIAAARETLEEAAMLHSLGGAAPTQEELFALRARLGSDAGALRAFLGERGLRLDLSALHPLARWITPEAEARRYDARFFVAVAPPGQTGAHDEHETMASFWATPTEVLRRWEAGEVQLAPPTHATLSLLSSCETTDAVLALAAASCLDPICPRLVRVTRADEADTLALTLPGDPEHEVRETRVPGRSRYVLRGDRWLPEDAPR